MSSRLPFLACLALVTACFNPDDPAVDTDAGATSGSTGESAGPVTGASSSGSSSAGSSTTAGTTVDPTVADTGSSTTGGEVPEWGEGEPPDFGDLGEAGEGSVLVVHTLSTAESVDVWLVGDSEPIATDLAVGEAVRLEGVERDARRVVLARAGTTEAVGCSEWFPLRADEQWATVATRGEHDCTSNEAGVTPTFEQTLALTGNTVRFVHGGRPDALTVERGGVPEPGMLQPGETLAGTDLPDCKSSGCTVDYTFSSDGVGAPRYVTFATVEVADVPPAGELMFVVLGDIRQEWPRELDSIGALEVSIEGDTRLLRRDPEVAFVAPDSPGDVTFLVPAPPSVTTVGVSEPCFQGQSCALETQRFRPGTIDFSTSGPDGNPGGAFDLEPGERYVLVYAGGTLMMLNDTFSRVDQSVSVGSVPNWSPGSLSIGRVFNGMGQAFPNFIDVPAGETSEENEVPDGNWDLVWGVGGKNLGADCFSPANTPAPWRGFFWAVGQLNLDSWPPSQAPLSTLCS